MFLNCEHNIFRSICSLSVETENQPLKYMLSARNKYIVCESTVHLACGKNQRKPTALSCYITP